MADIIGAFKKRFKGRKGKKQELPLDRTTLEALGALKAQISSEPSVEHVPEFSLQVKEFFQKLLKLRSNLTYEEFISEIAERRFTKEMKKEMVDFLKGLADMEYRPGGIPSKQLNSLIDSFGELVKKATSDSARPYPPKNTKKNQSRLEPLKLIKPATPTAATTPIKPAKPALPAPPIKPAKQATPVKQTKPVKEVAAKQPEPLDKEQELDKSVKKKGLFSFFSKKSDMSETQAALPMPPPPDMPEQEKFMEAKPAKLKEKPLKAKAQPKLVADEKLSDIYKLFNTAYDAIKKRDLAAAKDVHSKIKKLHSKLDKDSQSSFNDEIDHLNKEIAFFQKEQAAKTKKAQKAEAKAPEQQKPKLSLPPFFKLKPAEKQPAIEKQNPLDLLPPPPPPEDEPANPAPLLEPLADNKAKSPKKDYEIDVLKHPIKKKLFSKSQEKPDANVALPETDLAKYALDINDIHEEPEQVKDTFKIEDILEEAKPERKGKKQSAGKQSSLKDLPKPPIIPHLLNKENPALVQESVSAPISTHISSTEPSPIDLDIFSQADSNQEIVHEEPVLDIPSWKQEEQKKISQVVEQIHEEIKAHNKYRDEELWSQHSLISRIINKKHLKKIPANELDTSTLEKIEPLFGPTKSGPEKEQSEGETGITSEVTLAAKLDKAHNTKEMLSKEEKKALTKISSLIRQMGKKLSSRKLEEAEPIWGQITEAKKTLSPALTEKLEPIIAEISSELEAMKEGNALGLAGTGSAPLPASGQDLDVTDHNEIIRRILRDTPEFSNQTSSGKIMDNKKDNSDYSYPWDGKVDGPITGSEVTSGRLEQYKKSETPKLNESKSKETKPKELKLKEPKTLPLQKPAPQPKQPRLSKKELERQKQARLLSDLNESMDSARKNLGNSLLEDAKADYKKALKLKRRVKLEDAERNRINYELTDIDVMIRMAQLESGSRKRT